MKFNENFDRPRILPLIITTWQTTNLTNLLSEHPNDTQGDWGQVTSSEIQCEDKGCGAALSLRSQGLPEKLCGNWGLQGCSGQC